VPSLIVNFSGASGFLIDVHVYVPSRMEDLTRKLCADESIIQRLGEQRWMYVSSVSGQKSADKVEIEEHLNRYGLGGKGGARSSA
jgi:hypothetical protein